MLKTTLEVASAISFDIANDASAAIEEQASSTVRISNYIQSVEDSTQNILKESKDAQTNLELGSKTMEELMRQVKTSEANGVLVTEKVTGLKCVSKGTTSVRLRWNEINNATGYKVFQVNSSTGKWYKVADVATNEVVIKKLPTGTRTRFLVRAYKRVGSKYIEGGKSGDVLVVTKPNTPVLKVAAGAKKAVLSWNKSSSTVNGYYIYMATPVGNYRVEVKYKLKASDTEVKTAKYSVRNVDKVSPNIEIDKGNKVKIKTEDITGYISVNSMSDNLSGIKTVKYDYGDFINLYNNEDLKTHFEVTVVELKDDIIFIKSGYDKITVYIEDNAGNFYAEVIDAKLAAEISYPPIPIGFEYLTGTVNTGFVIKNSTDGNEFVWVPVEKGTFVREEGYYNGELQNYMSLTVEPHVTSDGDSEYNAMVESVSKYRGFYIAR